MPMIVDFAPDILHASERLDRELALVAGSLASCTGAFPLRVQHSRTCLLIIIIQLGKLFRRKRPIILNLQESYPNWRRRKSPPKSND